MVIESVIQTIAVARHDVGTTCIIHPGIQDDASSLGDTNRGDLVGHPGDQYRVGAGLVGGCPASEITIIECGNFLLGGGHRARRHPTYPAVVGVIVAGTNGLDLQRRDHEFIVVRHTWPVGCEPEIWPCESGT